MATPVPLRTGFALEALGDPTALAATKFRIWKTALPVSVAPGWPIIIMRIRCALAEQSGREMTTLMIVLSRVDVVVADIAWNPSRCHGVFFWYRRKYCPDGQKEWGKLTAYSTKKNRRLTKRSCEAVPIPRQRNVFNEHRSCTSPQAGPPPPHLCPLSP